MKQKATKEAIKNEANNGLKTPVVRWQWRVLRLRTPQPHSSSSTLLTTTSLNFSGESMQGWGYCVFAEVVEGMDVVDKIKGVSTGRSGMRTQDVPKEDVIIENVTVSE